MPVVMQVRRVRVSSRDWEKVVSQNDDRVYLRVAISTPSVSAAANPGVVQCAFDAASENYLMIWALAPFEPHHAPSNALVLKARKEPDVVGDVEVVVEITEGVMKKR